MLCFANLPVFFGWFALFWLHVFKGLVHHTSLPHRNLQEWLCFNFTPSRICFHVRVAGRGAAWEAEAVLIRDKSCCVGESQTSFRCSRRARPLNRPEILLQLALEKLLKHLEFISAGCCQCPPRSTLFLSVNLNFLVILAGESISNSVIYWPSLASGMDAISNPFISPGRRAFFQMTAGL